jgi:hypothetical protein
MDDIIEEITRKVEILRREIDSPGPGTTAPEGKFPPGCDIGSVPRTYLETFSHYVAQGYVAPQPAIEERLTFPPALVELYKITNGADAGAISMFELGSHGALLKGEIMGEDGDAVRDEEHWAEIGLIINDRFLVNLESGEVLYSDQEYWRYADGSDGTRVLAPDALTFFNEYVVGPKYGTIIPERRLDHAWLDDLRRLGLA